MAPATSSVLLAAQCPQLIPVTVSRCPVIANPLPWAGPTEGVAVVLAMWGTGPEPSAFKQDAPSTVVRVGTQQGVCTRQPRAVTPRLDCRGS
jgi:hypothetical protein